MSEVQINDEKKDSAVNQAGHIGSVISMIDFIKTLRDSDPYITTIFLEGSCYKLYEILSKLYNGCKPYISHVKDHVITSFNGEYYDINGIVNDVSTYSPMIHADFELAKSWSFGKKAFLEIAECEFCGNPILKKPV